jgi:hypothetical protein
MKSDLKKLAATDYFAPSYIQLCIIASQQPSQIPASVAAMAPLGEGSWKCVWGPVQNSDDANLVYVAAYYDGPSGLPVLCAIVTRGTEYESAEGLLQELWEDMDVVKQVPWPWPNGHNPGDASVAQGTLDGLGVVTSLTWQNQTVLGFVSGFVGSPANEGPVIVVTGHSLGGCLTTVLAPWLQYQLSQRNITAPIVPTTFAAPTAGNASFITMYQGTFPYCPRWYNSLDCVPMAWNNLSGIKSVYDAYGLSCPVDVRAAIDVFIGAMDLAGVTYSQQTANNAPLSGVFQTGDTWFQEMAHQHYSTTYASLIGNPAAREKLAR